MFIGPCIITYFYSKTNQMNQHIKFILLGVTLYMFRTFFPSIISYRHMLDTAKSQQSAVSDICLQPYVQSLHLMMDGKTVRNTQSVTPNKINLIHWCISLVLLQKLNTTSSSIDSTTLGGSRSVQQFYSTPVYPLPSSSNQQFSSSLGLLLPGPSP